MAMGIGHMDGRRADVRWNVSTLFRCGQKTTDHSQAVPDIREIYGKCSFPIASFMCFMRTFIVPDYTTVYSIPETQLWRHIFALSGHHTSCSSHFLLLDSWFFVLCSWFLCQAAYEYSAGHCGH